MSEKIATKDTIAYEDFARLDLRVARVLEADVHPGADRLLRLRLDDGSGTPRQVCAGIRAWYDPAGLVGRSVVIVANLQPRKIRGEMSEGMVLAASEGEGETERVVLVALDGELPPGSPVK
jgi:methionyl-tRNA synthetase